MSPGETAINAPVAHTEALTISKILRMAYDHWHVMNRWPDVHDGPVVGHPGETWAEVNSALEQGTRGLPGGSSLEQMLRTRGRKAIA